MELQVYHTKRFCEKFNQLSSSAESSSIQLKITSMQHVYLDLLASIRKNARSSFFFSPLLPDIIILDVDQIVCGFMERFEYLLDRVAIGGKYIESSLDVRNFVRHSCDVRSIERIYDYFYKCIPNLYFRTIRMA